MVQRPELPSDHELMRQWVELFRGDGRPYLLLGKMLHPPKLETAEQTVAGRTLPAILHQAYQAADGSRAVIVVNATHQPQPGRLHWAGRVEELELQPWQARLVH